MDTDAANCKPTFCATNVSATEDRFEFQLEDQRIRDSCLHNLEVAKNISDATDGGKPFFIGVGFHKPRE